MHNPLALPALLLPARDAFSIQLLQFRSAPRAPALSRGASFIRPLYRPVSPLRPTDRFIKILWRNGLLKRALITGITGQDGSYLTELSAGQGLRSSRSSSAAPAASTPAASTTSTRSRTARGLPPSSAASTCTTATSRAAKLSPIYLQHATRRDLPSGGAEPRACQLRCAGIYRGHHRARHHPYSRSSCATAASPAAFIRQGHRKCSARRHRRKTKPPRFIPAALMARPKSTATG